MTRLFSLLLVLGVVAGRADAAVVVTLDPHDASGNSIDGSVPAGSTLFVDILLSTDESESAAIEDVRSIQFNLENRFFRLLCHQSISMHSPYANMKKFVPQYSFPPLQKMHGSSVGIATKTAVQRTENLLGHLAIPPHRPRI